MSSTLLEEILLDEQETTEGGGSIAIAMTPGFPKKGGKRRKTEGGEGEAAAEDDQMEDGGDEEDDEEDDENDEEGDLSEDGVGDGTLDASLGANGSGIKGKRPRGGVPSSGPALAKTLSMGSNAGRGGIAKGPCVLRVPRTGALSGTPAVRTSSGSVASPALAHGAALAGSPLPLPHGLSEGRLKSLLGGIEMGSGARASMGTLFDGGDDLPDAARDAKKGLTGRDSLLNASGIVASDDAEVKPYPADNQLEYLEECFQLVALMVRGNAARLKDDLKKEGTRVNNWDANDGKHGKRELQAKLKLQEGRVERRVEKTKEASLPLPRLEVLAERLHLDAFERKMILLLIGKTVSPVVKTLMETLDGSSRVVDDVISVGQALGILCQDFQTQVANRKYFYRSGRLMSNGIISLSRSRWHQGCGDLTDNRIVLDRRVLDWTVGLDSEINELVEGSDLYEPKVSLSQVVLPPGHMETLCGQCKAYDNFRRCVRS